MKYALLFSLITIFAITSACGPKKDFSVEGEQSSQDMSEEFISGEVQEVNSGKDGYTAKLLTSEGKIYFATISIPNLKENFKQFRAVNVGETISVQGDQWEINGEEHITVRSMK